MGNISQIIQWDLIAYIVNNDFLHEEEEGDNSWTGYRIKDKYWVGELIRGLVLGLDHRVMGEGGFNYV